MRKESKERILFIGGKERGLEMIRYLSGADYNLVGIFCQEEEEHEAVKVSSLIKNEATSKKISFTLARTVNKAEHIAKISSLAPDLIIVMGWPTLISPAVLANSRLGAIAIHESRLPAYRGFAPISWQIINGETEIGLTLFHLDAGMDSGDIIAQCSLPIKDDEYIGEVYSKTGRLGVQMVKECLGLVLDGTAPRRKQNENMATYCCARIPDDGVIDWNRNTRDIYNLIRAVSRPYPGARTFYQGQKVMVWEAKVPQRRRFVGLIPGRVVAIHKEVGIEVLTRDGQLLLTRIQPEGKKEETADKFVRSVRVSFEK